MPAEVKASLASLIFERTRMLNMSYSRGAHSGSHRRRIDPSFFCSDTMRDEASPVEDIESFTQRMLALIAKRTQQMTSVKKGGHTSPTIEAKPPSAVPAQAIEGHSSRGSKDNPDQTSECEEAASASERHSTECLQTMREVAATCKNNEDESPVVMTTVLAVTLEEPTQKRSALHGSSSKEESKSSRLDINKTADDMDQLPGVLEGPAHITGEDQLDRSIESVEGVSFDDVHGLTNVSQDLQTKSVPMKKTFEPLSQNDHSENELAPQNSNIPDRKDITHSKLNSVGKIQINEDQSVPSSRSRAVGEEASAKTNGHKAECEDISETPQPAIKLCNAHFEELNPPLKEIQFENTSNESENEAVEKPSFSFSSPVTQSNREQMLCINSSDVHEQSVAHVEQVSVPDEELIKRSVSPKTVTFEKARHKSHSFCYESDNEESDDHWMVIPLTISDLRYEPGIEDQEGLETVQLDEKEAIETRCNRDQTTGVHMLDTCEVARSWGTPEVANGGEPNVPQKSSEQNPEPEDSCDTEDSCDYPPESKLNYMTVSGHFPTRIPAPLTPAPSVTVAEAEGQQDKNLPNGQTTGFNKIKEKLQQILKVKAGTKQKTSGENISKKTDGTFLHSDSDDEMAQRRKKKAKRRRRFPSTSESSEDPSCSQYGKQSPERVDTHKISMPSVDLQALQSHSTLRDTRSREVMQDVQLSDRTGESEWQIGTEAEPESVQHETKKRAKKRRVNRSEDTSCTDQVAPLRQSTLHGEELKETTKDPCSDTQTQTNADSESVQHMMCRHKTLNGIIILDSDSDDESEYSLKNNAKKRRLSPSSSKCKGDSTCIDQPPSQQQSKHHNKEFQSVSGSKTDSEPAQLKADMQKISTTENVIILSSDSDDDNDINRKQNKTFSEGTEVSTDSDQELRKTHRCKKVSFRKRLISSSEDSNNETSPATKERLSPEPKDYHRVAATRKPETDKPVSQESSKRPQQSMNRGTDSDLGSNPIIPLFVVSSPDHIHGPMKLQRRPQGSSSVCGKTLKKSGMVQTTVAKPPLVSRQFSFPPHVGPSTSNSDMSSSSKPSTKARRSSAPSSNLTLSGVSREALKLKNKCTPRLSMTSAKAQPPNPCRSPVTPDKICSPTEGSSYSTTQLTKSRILENWKRTFPNKGEVRRRRRRSWLDDNLGTTCHDSSGEVRPGPSCDTIRECRPGPSCDTIKEVRPRSSCNAIPGPSHSDLSGSSRPVPRHSDPLGASRPESGDHNKRSRRTRTKSLETTAPLMKKTKDYYRQLPKATSREPAKGQSYPVGENYKWGQPKKGPSREGQR